MTYPPPPSHAPETKQVLLSLSTNYSSQIHRWVSKNVELSHTNRWLRNDLSIICNIDECWCSRSLDSTQNLRVAIVFCYHSYTVEACSCVRRKIS